MVFWGKNLEVLWADWRTQLKFSSFLHFNQWCCWKLFHGGGAEGQEALSFHKGNTNTEKLHKHRFGHKDPLSLISQLGGKIEQNVPKGTFLWCIWLFLVLSVAPFVKLLSPSPSYIRNSSFFSLLSVPVEETFIV